MAFGYSKKGSAKVRLELQSPKASAPLKINITELLAELLPDSPMWYNFGSSIMHGLYGACEMSTAPAPASDWP